MASGDFPPVRAHARTANRRDGGNNTRDEGGQQTKIAVFAENACWSRRKARKQLSFRAVVLRQIFGVWSRLILVSHDLRSDDCADRDSHDEHDCEPITAEKLKLFGPLNVIAFDIGLHHAATFFASATTAATPTPVAMV